MGLIVWLPLNGDMRNNGLGNATLASTSATFTDGPWGKALSCNGSTYWTVNGITLGNDATIACWGKTSVSGKMKWVLQANVYAHLNLFESSFYTLNTGDSNNNPFKDGSNNVPVLTDNKWHHFVVTFGNNQAKLYIDGQYRGTAITFKSPACSIKNIRIAGGYSNAHSYDYNGAIDDFRVYDHCLTEDDIKNLYNCKTFDLVNQCNVAFDRAGQIASGVIPYNITTSGSAFYLNGSDAAIQIPFTDMQSGEFTMNTWFYKDSFGPDRWETIFGGPSGFELEMKNASASTPVIVTYSWGTKQIPYSLNQWNMLTMARTSGGTKFYLNGEYKQSGTAGSIPATSSTAGQYFIGAWKAYNSQNFKGYIKDFQIYAKELQASEISQLYEIGPQTSSLPDGYTKLQYITFTGTQYIEFPRLQSSTNIKLVFEFCPDDTSSLSQPTLMGIKNNTFQLFRSSTTQMGLWWKSGGSYGLGNFKQNDNNILEIYFDSTTFSCKLNNFSQSYSNTELYTKVKSGALLIGGYNPGTSYQWYGKLYSIEIYCDNSLVMYLVAAQKNTIKGMYDKISGTWYPPSTGSF